MTRRASEHGSNEPGSGSSGEQPTENAPTGHRADADRPVRKHKIPLRIPGGARTSTVALGICFVLTALLYGQVRPPAPGTVPEPQPASDVQPSIEPVAPSEISVTPTPESPSSSVTDEAPSTGSESNQSGTSTNDGPTSGESTFLPGVPVPPQLRSVVPPVPGATGTP